VLNALVSSKQIRFKQAPITVSTDGRVPDKIRERVPDNGQRCRHMHELVPIEFNL